MNVALVAIGIKEALNKLDSSDYDNFECWQIRNAFNKVQREWSRRQIIGANQQQAGDEETSFKVDDLQILLSPPKFLKGKNYDLYFESDLIPEDYFFMKRVTPYVKTSCGITNFSSKEREEGNVDDYLADWATQPAPEMQETFHTMSGNRIRVYTNGEFKVDKIKLTYYRLPREIDFTGCEHIDGSSGTNVDPEFKDDIVDILIDEAASKLAGDIESINQIEITKQRSNINT